MTQHMMYPVQDAGLLDAATVGHKFARLESMRRAGFPVPPLYCVPAAAFDLAIGSIARQLPALPLAGAADAAAVREWSAAAASVVAGLTVPAPVAEQALALFDEVIGRDGLAAVRACAVPAPGQPGEDDAADPFAGMSESYLYVPRAQLLARIAGCWASAYKPEAVLYRLRRGSDPAATRMSVGVQRMALGTRSFVVFTRDPRDGSARHVIAAAHGIGEGVVQEKADIDHFFVCRDTREVRADTVRKHRMVGAPAPGGNGAPDVLEVPSGLAEAPVLSDDQVRRVVAVAARIEQHFGCPQDIEGTLTADGGLHIVQARPMTVAAGPVTGTGRPRIVPWSNHNITESYPGVSSALTYSVARDFYRLIFTDLYRRMGVPERRLRRNAHHLGQMVGMLDGRVFYRLDAWLALHGQMPVFEFIRGWWEHGMGLAESARARPLRPGWRLRALRVAPGVARRMAAHPAAVRDFLRWWDRTAAAAAGQIDQQGPDELAAFYRRLWEQVGVRWGVTLTNTIFGVLLTVGLDELLRRWAGQRDHAMMLSLLSGGPENRSLAALRSAIALAELINSDDQMRERVLRAGQPETAQRVWAELVSGRHGPALATAAAEHLRRYGDRAAGDLKLEQPTPRQQPWMVLDMVRPYVQMRHTVAASRAGERSVRKAAERELRQQCPDPARRAALRLLAAAMRRFTKAREDTRFCRSELYGLSRQVLLRLGAELAAAGHLDQAGDVIDLTADEVLGAFEGTVPTTDLRRLAAHRRDERAYHASLPEPPSRQATAAGTPLARPLPLAGPDRAAAPGGRLLTGLASSTGVVRGRAKVVLDPSVPPESCQDMILIARETDPGWLFLMTVAKGMVVERGTLLSHTAITGRLLGVPTVVAVPGATSTIPDGVWVELDGGAGTVRVLQEHTS